MAAARTVGFQAYVGSLTQTVLARPPPLEMGRSNKNPKGGTHGKETLKWAEEKDQVDDHLDYGPCCGMTPLEWQLLPDRVKLIGSSHINEVWVTFFMNYPNINEERDCSMDFLPEGFLKLSTVGRARFSEIATSCFTYLPCEHATEVQADIEDKQYFQTSETKISELQEALKCLKKLVRLKRNLEYND